MPQPTERKQQSSVRAAARFAYSGLDRLIHERARLSILTSLAAHPQGLVFNDLKMLCALTDGNLSRQLQILSDAGLLEIHKGVHNRRPQTRARLTAGGRKQLSEYLSVLEGILTDAAASPRAQQPAALGGNKGLSIG